MVPLVAVMVTMVNGSPVDKGLEENKAGKQLLHNSAVVRESDNRISRLLVVLNCIA